LSATARRIASWSCLARLAGVGLLLPPVMAARIARVVRVLGCARLLSSPRVARRLLLSLLGLLVGLFAFVARRGRGRVRRCRIGSRRRVGLRLLLASAAPMLLGGRFAVGVRLAAGRAARSGSARVLRTARPGCIRAGRGPGASFG